MEVSLTSVAIFYSMTMENWEKVAIVVPKIAFWGNFGTTIGSFLCFYAVLGCA